MSLPFATVMVAWFADISRSSRTGSFAVGDDIDTRQATVATVDLVDVRPPRPSEATEPARTIAQVSGRFRTWSARILASRSVVSGIYSVQDRGSVIGAAIVTDPTEPSACLPYRSAIRWQFLIRSLAKM